MAKAKSDNSWVLVDLFMHEESKLGVKITKRKKGPPAFNMEMVFERAKDRHTNFIPVSASVPEGQEYQIEDVMRALVEKARLTIEKLHAEEAKKHGSKKPRVERKETKKVGGLSELAKRDAAKGNHEYVGKSQRKKGKKSA